MDIQGCLFEGNKSILGSALSINSMPKLSDNSIVNNTIFKNNSASYKSNIYIVTHSGSLTFENCQFIDNIARGGEGNGAVIYTIQ